MNKKNIIICGIILFVLILITILVLVIDSNMNANSDIDNTDDNEDTVITSLEVVTDENDFFTVKNIINSFLELVKWNDADSLYNVINDNYINENGITLNNILSRIDYNYFSSNYVWNIEVIEENNQDLPNIMQDLQNAGLSVGTQKRKIDTKEIINSIRLNREDVAWMGIELKGTNAIVKVVKADEAPQIIDDTEYCNIVADKDGIITKIKVPTIAGSTNRIPGERFFETFCFIS